LWHARHQRCSEGQRAIQISGPIWWHKVFDRSRDKAEISRWRNSDTSWLPSKDDSNGTTRLRTGKQISNVLDGLHEP